MAALGGSYWSKQYYKLKEGYLADITIKIAPTPINEHNVYDQLVLLEIRNVVDVMVDGKFVMKMENC